MKGTLKFKEEMLAVASMEDLLLLSESSQGSERVQGIPAAARRQVAKVEGLHSACHFRKSQRPGEAADETSGVVQGPARVGLDGWKPGEEILVVEETSVSYVKHFAQLKGLVRALVRNQPHLQNNQRNQRTPGVRECVP